MKRILLFLCIWMGVTTLNAQTAASCFKALPDSLSPLLSKVNREDCIDFLESKMKAEVVNRLGQKSEMTHLTADYIRMQLTSHSTWQMKVLPLNDTTRIICTVSTVCAPACDSHFRFYTTEWKEVPTSGYLPALPVRSDFLLAAPDSVDALTYQEIVRPADMLLMRADLSEQEQVLTFTFTTPDYMSVADAERLRPFVGQPVIYRWEEGQFRRVVSQK